MLHESNLCSFTCSMKEVLSRWNTLYNENNLHTQKSILKNIFITSSIRYFKKHAFFFTSPLRFFFFWIQKEVWKLGNHPNYTIIFFYNFPSCTINYEINFKKFIIRMLVSSLVINRIAAYIFKLFVSHWSIWIPKNMTKKN